LDEEKIHFNKTSILTRKESEEFSIKLTYW